MESGSDTFALKESSPTSPINANGLHHSNTFFAAPISEKNDRGSGTTSAFDKRQQNTPSRFTEVRQSESQVPNEIRTRLTEKYLIQYLR